MDELTGIAQDIRRTVNESLTALQQRALQEETRGWTPRLFFKTNEDWTSLLTDLWIRCGGAHMYQDKELWIGLLSAFYNLNKIVSRAIVSAVFRAFGLRKPNLESQAHASLSVIAPLATLMVVGFGFATGDFSKPTESITRLTTLFKPMGNLGKTIDGFTKLITLVIQGISTVIETVFGNARWYKLVFGTESSEMKEFTVYFLERDFQEYRNVVAASKEEAERVIAWAEKLKSWMPNLVKVEAMRKQTAKDLFWKAAAVLKKVEKAALACVQRAGTSRRKEPFSLYLTGDPGTGKSLMVAECVLQLAAKCGITKSEISDLSYCRNSNSDHYDGYRGQFALVRDDCFTSGSMNLCPEVSEFLQEVSTNVYMPPFAFLQDKGTYFTSRVVISCSNSAYPNISEFICKDALLRRRHVVIEFKKKCQGTVEKDGQVEYFFCDPVHTGHFVRESTYDIQVVRDFIAEHFMAHEERQAALAEKHAAFIDSIFDEDSEDFLLAEMGVVEDPYYARIVQQTNEFKDLVQRKFVSCRDKVLEAYDSFLFNEVFPITPLRGFLLASGAIVAALGMIKIVGSILSPAEEIVEVPVSEAGGLIRKSMPHAYSIGRERTYKAKKVVGPRRIIRARPVSKAQADIQPVEAGFDLPKEVASRTWRLKVTSPGNDMGRGGVALQISHQHMLTCSHSFPYTKTHLVEMTHIETGKKVMVALDPRTMQRKDDMDMVIFEAPSLPPKRDLVKHMPMLKELKYMNGGVGKAFLKDKTVDVRWDPCLQEQKYECANTVYTMLASYDTPAISAPGDSGSPFIAQVYDRFGDKFFLMGFFVAGNKRYSSIMPVVKEVIQPLLDVLYQNDFIRFQIEKPLIGHAIELPLEPGAEKLQLLQQLDARDKHNTPSRSKLVKSPIHGIAFPVECGPSVLYSSDRRLDKEKQGTSILYSSVGKFTEVQGSFVPFIRTEIFDAITEIVDNEDHPDLPRRLLTMDECINGVRYEDGSIVSFCPGIEMSSSPGYGFSGEKKGKVHLFEGDVTEYVMSAQLEEAMREREANLLSDDPYRMTLWTDCLKDEKRSLAKIKAGKTRSFCIPTIDFSLLVRKYFGSFIAMMRSKAMEIFSCVGINPESTDWHYLHAKLAKGGAYGLDLDFRNFDGKAISPEFLVPIASMITSWYNDNNYTARLKLLYDVVHAVSRCGSYIVERHQGNSSGWPMTTELNCIVSYFLVAYAYIITGLDQGKAVSMDTFLTAIVIFTYGDDVILSADEETRKWFTGNSIRDVLGAVGIEVTAANKTPTIEYQPIEDLTFLKRNFRYSFDLGSHVPMLSEATLRNMTQYIHSQEGHTHEEMLRPNLNEILWFASFHGQEVFQRFKERINSAMKQIGFTQLVCTYDVMMERQRKVFDQSEIPLCDWSVSELSLSTLSLSSEDSITLE